MSRELMQKRIAKAQREIDEKKNDVKNGAMRQHYHFMPQTGWMNDPNGLIFYKGKYHFFYQSNPYDGFWNSMHWGHAVSEDLMHWEYLPLALAPSETYDDHLKGGCFSGSAIEHDGKLWLIYTGTANEGHGVKQTQCLAWSEDGVHFEKYEGNPVIEAPEGFAEDSFRDPKIWKHGDDFYLVVGTSRNNRGLALIYRSGDLLDWEYLNVLAESRGEWGYMWECPDFYELDGRYILTFSPMGSGDHTSVYLVGDFDYQTGKFEPHESGEFDWGFDYYAPQSFLAPDGRRIVVAWANEWEWMPLWKDWGPTYREGWCGFFNIAREVQLCEDHTLQFLPVKEMETIRKEKEGRPDFEVADQKQELKAGDGVCFEMKFKIDLEKSNADRLTLMLRCGEDRETRWILDFKEGEIRTDRNRADGWSRGISRSSVILCGKKELDVHIFSDQSSLEIFADRYRNNHSNNIFAGNAQNQIYILADGGTVRITDYEAYGLQECFR